VPKVSDAHKERRRRQILDGARRAFARHGYEAATVPVLEEEIGLSRGAIFSYYPSKHELFVAMAEDDQRALATLWIEQGFEAVVRQVAESPDWIGAYLEVPRMLRADPSLLERWQRFNPDLQEGLAAWLEGLRDAGEVRTDLDVETIGRFFGIVLDGLAVQQGAGVPIDVEGTLTLVRSALAPK
jgi:AcrR family transcriptional regulator